MNPVAAYLLGALTIIALWLIFYLGARFNDGINTVYTNLICPL